MYRLAILPTLLFGLLFLGLSSCKPVLVTPSAEVQSTAGTPTAVVSPTANLPLRVKIVVPLERNAEIVNAWVADQPNWEPETQEVQVVTDLEVGDFAVIFLVPKGFVTDAQSTEIETIVGEDFAAQYIVGNIPEAVIATIADDLLPRLVLEDLPPEPVEGPIAVWTPAPIPTPLDGGLIRPPWPPGMLKICRFPNPFPPPPFIPGICH